MTLSAKQFAALVERHRAAERVDERVLQSLANAAENANSPQSPSITGRVSSEQRR